MFENTIVIKELPFGFLEMITLFLIWEQEYCYEDNSIHYILQCVYVCSM